MLVDTSPNLDELLLDIATSIELSPKDRNIAEARYKQLKQHLERSSSPIASYLGDESHIYAQGSMATGTTVVTGKNEERFDLDALVEIAADQSPQTMMDLLYKSLENFPGATKVIRCTRCVQMHFASMHMDVTLMKPTVEPRPERTGDIFHCPDEGPSSTVPANPYGFSQWFRDHVHLNDDNFAKTLSERRLENGIDRLGDLELFENASRQDDLPPMLPTRLDSEQVIALKLLKRYVSLQYEERNQKRPPSIYLSKMTIDTGPSSLGLCAQLIELAQYVHGNMKKHLDGNTFPDERNPTFKADRLNDRWPAKREDMQILATDMQNLTLMLNKARVSDFKEINRIFETLFGERVAKRSADAILARANAEGKRTGHHYEEGTGALIQTKSIAAPAVIASIKQAPPHQFHSSVLANEKDA